MFVPVNSAVSLPDTFLDGEMRADLLVEPRAKSVKLLVRFEASDDLPAAV